MDTAHLILLIIHGIALLALLIGLFLQFGRAGRGEGQVTTLALASSGLMLLTGLAMAGIFAAEGVANFPKLGIKLLIAAAIFGGLLAHRGKSVSRGMLIGMVVLTLVNTAIAVAW